MLAVSVRKVQQLASQGRLPGAARIDNIWTFDPAQIRAWIRRQEHGACHRTYTAEAIRTTVAIPSTASYSESAYEQAISGKFAGGSAPSARKRSSKPSGSKTRPPGAKPPTPK
jgi:hypothetical protein